MLLDNMFYNFTYNFGHERGQLKFNWGVSTFDISKPLKPQLIKLTGVDESEIFNLDLNTFNPLIISQAAKVGEQ